MLHATAAMAIMATLGAWALAPRSLPPPGVPELGTGPAGAGSASLEPDPVPQAQQRPPTESPGSAEVADDEAAGDGDGSASNGGPGGAGAGDGGAPPAEDTDDGPDPGSGDAPASDPGSFEPHRPSTRRCVGNPPRQIEDPQSPPCVSGWQGTDNGGATARGVTADRIIIANPWARPNNELVTRAFDALEAFFNERFEFYGREIDLVPAPFDNQGDYGGSADSRARLAEQAETVANEIGAFASIGSWFGTSNVYEDRLADLGVISAFAIEPVVDEDAYRARHPYQWSYTPDLSYMGRNLGEWICKQLPPDRAGAPQNAEHAGTPQDTMPRKFGYLLSGYHDLKTPDNPEGAPDTSGLDAALAACDAVPGDDERAVVTYASIGTSRSEAQNAMVQFASRGVTSVICLCKITDLRNVHMQAATNQGFFPEWIVTSFGQNDFDYYFGANAPNEQMRHLFGISFRNDWVPIADLPVTWAIKEIDPSFQWPEPRPGGSGGFQEAQFWQAWRYPPLLLLAAGIQQAGPHLTPETFAAGLQATSFPNPHAFPYPGYGAADVSFARGHTMVTDASIIWWGIGQQSTWGGVGAWCQAADGQRYTLGQWPEEPIAMFTGDGATC